MFFNDFYFCLNVASPGIEPGSGASETLILSIVLRGQSKISNKMQNQIPNPNTRIWYFLFEIYLINPLALVANTFTAMASKITPKNFRTASNPAFPRALSIRFSDLSTI